jgi:hypothetical protein
VTSPPDLGFEAILMHGMQGGLFPILFLVGVRAFSFYAKKICAGVEKVVANT